VANENNLRNANLISANLSDVKNLNERQLDKGCGDIERRKPFVTARKSGSGPSLHIAPPRAVVR
jgi:hypothetical protein